MADDAVSPDISPALVRAIERIERDAWADLYAAVPAQARQALGVEHRTVDDGVILICRALDHIQFNRLAGLGIETPPQATALDSAIAAFDAAKVKNWIVHIAAGAGGPAALCEARGLKQHPRAWAKFVRDGTAPPAVATALTVKEIGSDAAAAFGAVAAQSFGTPPIFGEWLAALPGRARWRCFVAFDGTLPVATGALFVDPPLAWLGIGATLASHRGQRAQPAILAARIAAAAALGCTTLTTETGIPHAGEPSPSYDNILQAGFRIAYPRPNLWRGS